MIFSCRTPSPVPVTPTMRYANTAVDLRSTDSSRPSARLRIEPRPLTEFGPGEMAGAVLRLASELQRSLDLDALLGVLHESLRPRLAQHGLLFESPREHIRVSQGVLATHQVSYEIVLLGESLGTLTVARQTPFGEEELARLETLLCALVYPLRNALLYRRALETAYKDPVTGVNNRLAFEQALAREVDLSRRHDTPLSLLLLDIDHFKQVNDRYGHVFGDCVLRGVADVILGCTRGSDIVFRYGGEEFSLLLANTELAGAHCLAERVCEAVRGTPLLHDGVELSLTVSVGLAERLPEEGGQALVERADAALYRAKSAGRDRVMEA